MAEDAKPVSKSGSERLERGLTTRRDVTGADYVDRSLGQADDFEAKGARAAAGPWANALTALGKGADRSEIYRFLSQRGASRGG
jgi:hypothetical protein